MKKEPVTITIDPVLAAQVKAVLLGLLHTFEAATPDDASTSSETCPCGPCRRRQAKHPQPESPPPSDASARADYGASKLFSGLNIKTEDDTFSTHSSSVPFGAAPPFGGGSPTSSPGQGRRHQHPPFQPMYTTPSPSKNNGPACQSPCPSPPPASEVRRSCPACLSLAAFRHNPLASMPIGIIMRLDDKGAHYHWFDEDFNGKYYVVTAGRAVGIFMSWHIAAPLVHGVTCNAYKSYELRSEAVAHWKTAELLKHVKIIT